MAVASWKEVILVCITVVVECRAAAERSGSGRMAYQKPTGQSPLSSAILDRGGTSEENLGFGNSTRLDGGQEGQEGQKGSSRCFAATALGDVISQVSL